ncbi:MAG: DUF6069 family protein [Actinomycetota bacterium]|nr:DUF6069 family protein [Actinomycetota bacterium]
MTALTTPDLPSAGPSRRTRPSTPSLWRPGLTAGLAAAAATVAVAAVARAVFNVSLETAPGKAIPVLGFGQLTLFFTAIGVLIARTIRGRAGRPRSTFTRTAVVLTALSVVPDLLIPADAATKITLVLTHLVAAAIVVPALSSHLPEHGRR